MLEASALAALQPEVLAESILVPHPAARWATFEAMPCYTIWRRHREDAALGDELPWQGESALLTRPAGAVEWHALDAAGAAFLCACDCGLGFADAIEAAVAASPGADQSLGAWLPPLLAAGAFCRIESKKPAAS